MRSTAVRISTLAALALFAAAACSDDPAAPPEPASVSISPASARLVALGDTVRFTAQVRDDRGNVLPDVPFAWSVAQSAIATVDAQGLVTALAPGVAEVRATVGSAVAASATVEVEQMVSALELGNLPDSMIAGSTVMLSALPRDANANEVTGAAITWSTSDPAVATVAADGLVSALDDGIVTIRASAGGVEAEARIDVLLPHVELPADTVLSGTVEVRSLSVPAGATITAAGDLTFAVQERATVLGSIVADCRAVAIRAGGAVAIAGTIDTVCSDTTAAPTGTVTIIGTDSVSVTGETNASGGIYISNDATLTDADFPAIAQPGDAAGAALRRTVPTPYERRRLAGIRSARADGECIVGGELLQPITSPFNQDGVPGNSGQNQGVRCRGRLVLTGGVIRASAGEPGGDVEVSSSTVAIAEGATGGPGGDVRIESTGDIVFAGNTALESGAGGGGGDAVATGLPGGTGQRAADAEATGGAGGPGGNVHVAAGGSVSGTFVVRHGHGGSGGRADAYGADGRHATAAEAAQAGGRAIARGGKGGSSGGSNFFGGGGSAIAHGGKGGNGSESFLNGAAGGASTAIGGEGGDSRDPALLAASGGGATVSRGGGGDGFGTCEPPAAQGGAGGQGGSIGGHGGAEGQPRAPSGLSSSISILQAANGGRGGSGLSPGLGGAAGVDAIEGPRQVVPTSLEAGADGETCVIPTQVSIALGEGSISNTHDRTSDPCPQHFGTTTVTNTSNVRVAISASAPTGLSTTVATTYLDPGESTSVAVFFTCNRPESFVGIVNISAHAQDNSGLSASLDLTVNVTVTG